MDYKQNKLKMYRNNMNLNDKNGVPLCTCGRYAMLTDNERTKLARNQVNQIFGYMSDEEYAKLEKESNVLNPPTIVNTGTKEQKMWAYARNYNVMRIIFGIPNVMDEQKRQK